MGSPRKYDAELWQKRRRKSTYFLVAIWKRTHLGDHERLDSSGMRNVRTNAEIDHRAATIDSGGCAIWNLGLDEVLLVLVVLHRGQIR